MRGAVHEARGKVLLVAGLRLELFVDRNFGEAMANKITGSGALG